MVLSLNRKWLVLVLGLFISTLSFSQETAQQKVDDNSRDYKDPKQHERFRKRRFTVAAWQINQLKNGALVVRLKTSEKVIAALKSQGDTEGAMQKEVEQYAVNKDLMRSYREFYKFSKLYFIYSYSSDTLLKGARKGIFLGEDLSVDPNIVMSEDYYVIAERDYVYNSSIGFVPEDSARFIIEGGNPTREMAIVLKNKYNHQLKGPLPFFVQDKTYTRASSPLPVKVRYREKDYDVSIRKEDSYEKMSTYVDQLESNLRQFYQANPDPKGTKMYEEVRPFLY